MGQFKPMVKMMTTEPSVELKLKKGGKVEKKMQMGGNPEMAAAAPAMRTMGAPARGGMMGAQAPMKPSLMARRKAMRAMPAGAGPAGPAGMAGRMMKEGGETSAEHMAEMRKMAKTAKKLEKHESMPASKAHKGLKRGGMACATGGVVNGQGGYKKGGKVKMAGGGYCAEGGIINTEGQGGKYRNTKMDTTKPDHSPAKTGGVKMGNAGGYKKGGMACATGGVAKSNAGGYKKGGAAKKFADGGMSGSAPVGDRQRQLEAEVLGAGYMSDEERRYLQEQVSKSMRPEGSMTEVEREVVRKIPLKRPVKKMATGGAVNDSGKAEKMPQGHKRASTPVSINQLSGTFKKGGAVMTPAQKRLSKTFKSENASAMKAAKKMSNEKYGR